MNCRQGIHFFTTNFCYMLVEKPPPFHTFSYNIAALRGNIPTLIGINPSLRDRKQPCLLE